MTTKKIVKVLFGEYTCKLRHILLRNIVSVMSGRGGGWERGGGGGNEYEQKCTVPVRRILLLSPEVFVQFSFPSAVRALL